MAIELIQTGLQIRTEACILLPADLGLTMLSIQHLIPSAGLEYGLYLKGRWVPERLTVEVEPGQFYFPKQIASSAHITFEEDPPGPEWNVVFHRHPTGVRGFSGTDRESVNKEFLASLLFIPPWDFPAAVVNVPIARGSKLQVQAAIDVTTPVAAGLAETVKAKFSAYKPPAPPKTQITGSKLAPPLSPITEVRAQGGKTNGTVTAVPHADGFRPVRHTRQDLFTTPEESQPSDTNVTYP